MIDVHCKLHGSQNNELEAVPVDFTSAVDPFAFALATLSPSLAAAAAAAGPTLSSLAPRCSTFFTTGGDAPPLLVGGWSNKQPAVLHAAPRRHGLAFLLAFPN
jgi:hypothetical protein